MHLLEPKFTFSELCVELMLSQHFHHHLQMLYMLFLGPRIDQDIVDEHDDELVQIFLEHSVHQVHEGSWSIG